MIPPDGARGGAPHEEARRKKAEQTEARGAVRSAVRGILNESAELPSLEEQRNFALTRAEAVEDPDIRQKARAEIEQELAWRMLRRDARIMRAMLDFRNAARSEGLSPEQRRERLEQEDMPEDVRTALFDELERGGEHRPDADNMARAMNLLRFIDTARAGGRAPTPDDILAAGLRGGLTDGQVESALAYLENDTLSLSRLDDICLDLGMAPDEHGEVRGIQIDESADVPSLEEQRNAARRSRACPRARGCRAGSRIPCAPELP